MTRNQDAARPYCEWRRCGGRGHKVTSIRRRAQVSVSAGDIRYLTCESCADFAVRELRAKGLMIEKAPL